jgi:uncharacterized BrkB/YihY/UPF0761 family membrane protein
VTLRAVHDWWNDNCLRLAASLAYYTALSLAPLILLIDVSTLFRTQTLSGF